MPSLDFYYHEKRQKKDKAKSAPTQIIINKEVVNESDPKKYSVDRKRFTYALIFCGLILLIWWLFSSTIFTVKKVIYDQEPNASIKSKIESLKGKNILTLYPSKLAKEWQKEQPSIKNLYIYTGLPDTLRISVEERSKALAWNSQGKYYLIDTYGVAYRLTDKKETHLAIIDDKNLPVELGQQIISADFIEFVQKLLDEVPGLIKDDNIKELHVEESSFTVAILTDKNIRLKFDITQPAELQFDALKYMYENKRDEVKQYIDLRVIGKAYYR